MGVIEASLNSGPTDLTDSDVKENVWIWNNDGNDFYMDKNETIRFRIEEEAFEDQLPIPPHMQDDRMEAERKPPYRLIVGPPKRTFRTTFNANCFRHLLNKLAWGWCRGGRMKGRRRRRRRRKVSISEEYQGTATGI